MENKKEELKDYIDKQFYFILGAPRTGGTYIFTQIADVLSFPWKNLLQKMTHDHIPHGFFLNGGKEGINQLGWRNPSNYVNAVFQICQFLVYYKREKISKNIVLKNISLCYGIKLLDNIFKQKAHYIITVRHPAAMSYSRAKTFEIQETNKIKKTHFNIWYSLYHEVVRDGLPEGDISTISYGKDFIDFLNKFHQIHDQTKKPLTFSPEKRDYDTDFWSKKELKEKINYLKELWSIKGLTFPDIQEIL